MASREEVLGLAEGWVQAYNGKDYDRLSRLFAPDLVLRDHGMGLVLEGGQAFVDGIREVAETAIPDRRVTIERSFVDGDTVVLQGRWTGTVQVEKWGMPPGTRHSHLSCSVIETRNGQIVSITDYTCPDKPST